LKRFPILPALVALACLNPIGASAQQPTNMTPGQVSRLPFSNGLPLGDSLYVSGHLGVDPAVGKPSDDPEEEAKKVLESVEATLKQNGMGMDDLVYVEIFCTDLKLYTAFNKVYGPMFHKAYPARAFIGVKELLFGAHFEVMGIAVKNAAQTKK
jgi:2-iminobutanoate/2-iminopropanoate deaminase